MRKHNDFSGIGEGTEIHILTTCTHVVAFMFDVTEQVGLGLGWGGDVHVLRTCTQGYLNQKDLMQYVHRWQWRRSCDCDLFTTLGQACIKLHSGPSKLLPRKSDVPKMLAAAAKRTQN